MEQPPSPAPGNRRWLFLLAGDENKASSRVRGFWIAGELRKQGQQCTLLVCDTPQAILRSALLIARHDIVVFQKVYSRHHRRLQRLCALLGKRTVVDIDDAPSKSNNARTLEVFQAMCRTADTVFAGCQALVDHAEAIGARAELLPTGIRCDDYPIVRHSAKPDLRIAWVGDAGQYARDIEEILLPALLLAAERHKLVFRVIGAMNHEPLRLSLENRAGLEIELVETLEWSRPGAVAEQLQDVDIGVYPLLDTPFNRYKCGFKALEYMACAIPVIATPNPANKAIIKDGTNGLLASDETGWSQALEKLITNPALRSQLGNAGRRTVTEAYDTAIIARRALAIAGARLR